MIRICTVGCGAIGGVLAAHLAKLDQLELWAYDVSEPHVAAINRDGLRITGTAELVSPVHARTDPAAIPECALGIVAAKGTLTEPAIAATARVFGDAAVCSVQNGIGNEELIARFVPRVIRGVTLVAGRVVAPGVIHMNGSKPTWLGPFEPKPAAMAEVERLAGFLDQAGLPAHALPDARGAQWTKLLFNCATNPLSALTGLTHGQVCEHPPTRRLAAALIREGRAVAASLSITLDGDPDTMIDDEARSNYHHRPSMLQDVIARRQTEIATLNGGIVAAGIEQAVPTPLNEAIAALISGLERSWSAERA